MATNVHGPSVAIIGGGIAGLVCAARLGQLGITATTVFDTGRHAPGGRCSTRTVDVGGKTFLFDHSAQYFTVSDNRFAKIVSFLHAKGAVKVWNGPIGVLKGGRFVKNANLQAFVGTGGMKSVPECLATLSRVQRPAWVGNVVWEPMAKKWKVDKYGYFDYLVIAHNGKCADRLMGSAGAPKIHELLRVRFTPKLIQKVQQMQLCSLWVLLVVFPTSLKLPFEGAFVEDSDVTWVANNTAKLGQRAIGDNSECWTIFSSRQFGAAHKVPQENIPPGKADEVTKRLLAAFAKSAGLDSRALPSPTYTKVQLWGAAVPLNVLDGADCVFQASQNVGICGDWLVSPCIEGAAVSGLALAESIHRHVNGERRDTGLGCTFKPVHGPPIGSFPTNSKLVFNPGGKTG
uniref:Amine oxidase domain-containing protein n=1 Tax=Branchiostoma floridae TaxID=7739 RepID=C3Z5I8_BRAFL|eukprot:XP_002596089.1 hypothetical protein BRAFLDRAFT_118054 [Branchiostoma floridae]